MTWDEAKAHCQSNYRDLAIVLNDKQQRLLHKVAGSPVRKGWIGLHHIKLNWSWTMEDGYEDGSFQTWTDRPTGFKNQCAFFESGHWSQALCSIEIPFICQNAGKLKKKQSMNDFDV